MEIQLPYGSGTIPLRLDDAWDVTVVTALYTPGLADPEGGLTQALHRPRGAPPLAEWVRAGETVGIVVNDVTRATPTPLILRAILRELAAVPDNAITLFNATGTHRANTPAELEAMLGADLSSRFEIVQNDARDRATQTYLGQTRRGHPIWINRRLLDCDRLLLTGFIEPHFFAGFSGGGKAIMPGMGGLDTVLANHGPEMIADPHSTWGITVDNPIWEEIMEVGLRVGKSFLVNVVMNPDRAITGVFAGELSAAYPAGCDFARETSMAKASGLFDLVIASNSGYPLDQNLYQAVKGMSAAAQIVGPGGAIVIAAECRDGVPEGSSYQALLAEAGSPACLLERLHAPGPVRPDQWQVQIQAQIQANAEVHVFSGCLTPRQIEAALFTPVASLEEAVRSLVERFGATARIAVLPDGPIIIPIKRLSQPEAPIH